MLTFARVYPEYYYSLSAMTLEKRWEALWLLPLAVVSWAKGSSWGLDSGAGRIGILSRSLEKT